MSTETKPLLDKFSEWLFDTQNKVLFKNQQGGEVISPLINDKSYLPI